MTDRVRSSCLALICGVAAAALANEASACAGAGLITRISGKPQDVIITRTEAGQKPTTVARPRVLEMVCSGDVIRVQGGTRMTLSVDGVGPVQVASAYTVPVRKGSPTVAGNVYRSINDKVVPDMKRLPWDVRLKGAGTGFEFALPALASGKQMLRQGKRDVLVRLAGGSGPYTVQLLSAEGKTAGSAKGSDADVTIRGASLTPGTYRLKASDSAGNVIEAQMTVSSAGPPSVDAAEAMPDAEIGAAVKALQLAKAHPDTWSLEAEQILAAAPEAGLDRARVYQLLESYDAGG
jgi:hypothetical protein